MIFITEKFFSNRAARDAAKFFAECLSVLESKLDLTNAANENDIHKWANAAALFPQLVLEFLKKSPPVWPGQEDVLISKGLCDKGLSPSHLYQFFYSLHITEYEKLIVSLCSEYFCNAFYLNCTNREKNGDFKGTIGKADMTLAIEKVFEASGTNTFFHKMSAALTGKEHEVQALLLLSGRLGD